jgi:hypothetical protein
MTDNVRIELSVSPEKLADIEQLMRDCGLKKKTDLVNNALTLLKWAVKAVKDGRTIASVDERNHKYRDLEMPVLAHAREQRASKQM